ncbi:MAG: hypothetical protein R3F59_25160 [Myxococcota bacterium]
MWLGALVAGLALAKSPTLHTSADAEVVLLPRTAPDRIEIGVYHNKVPIAIDVRSWKDPAIDYARAVDVGGGTSFVTIQLVDDGVVAQLLPAGTHTEVRLVRGTPELVAPDAVPTVEALFEGVPRQTAPWPEDLALVPLLREARTFALPPDEHRMDIRPLDLHPGMPALAPVPDPTWDDVARWRGTLPLLRDGATRSIANYRLGLAHKRLGLPREAAYYFARAGETGFPAPEVFLELADAAFASRQWDIGRKACRTAWERGADDAQVLECLGVLALATDAPAAAPTARALAAATTRPRAQQLAGERLLRDGYAAEAAPLLLAAAEHLPPPSAERAWAALGDARLALGATESARRAFLATPHLTLEDELEVREVAARMLTDGVRRWPAWIPTLTGFADRGGPAGNDALYLLAQVHDRYNDHEAVASDLAQLWARGVRTTDVAPRLLRACTARAEVLAHDERHAELAALFDVCWPEGMAEHVDDVRLPDLASRALEALGLRDEALRTQLELTTILAGVGREDPLQLGRLAHLQAATGRAARALETIAYARRLSDDPGVQRRLDLDVAEAHAALGHTEQALAMLDRAAQLPALAADARERRGILELRDGRCAEGIGALSSRLKLGPIGTAPPAELELLWAHCATQLGRTDEAIAAAELAVGRADDDRAREEARWVASVAAARDGRSLPEALQSDRTAFGAVRTEDERHAAFLDQLRAWTRGRR